MIAQISAEPIDVAGAIAAVTDDDVGGIGVFVGTVRAIAAERAGAEVVRLDYEAHPTLALNRLNGIVAEATQRFSLEKMVAIHRTGVCELGAVTVVVACAAQHRAEALDACRWAIDTIKSTVPIWKKEVYADGHAWVGAEHQLHGAR